MTRGGIHEDGIVNGPRWKALGLENSPHVLWFLKEVNAKKTSQEGDLRKWLQHCSTTGLQEQQGRGSQYKQDEAHLAPSSSHDMGVESPVKLKTDTLYDGRIQEEALLQDPGGNRRHQPRQDSQVERMLTRNTSGFSPKTQQPGKESGRKSVTTLRPSLLRAISCSGSRPNQDSTYPLPQLRNRQTASLWMSGMVLFGSTLVPSMCCTAQDNSGGLSHRPGASPDIGAGLLLSKQHCAASSR